MAIDVQILFLHNVDDFSTPPTLLHDFDWNFERMLHHNFRCAWGR